MKKLTTQHILILGRSISYSMYLKAGKKRTATNFSRIYFFQEMHQLVCVKSFGGGRIDYSHTYGMRQLKE